MVNVGILLKFNAVILTFVSLETFSHTASCLNAGVEHDELPHTGASQFVKVPFGYIQMGIFYRRSGGIMLQPTNT